MREIKFRAMTKDHSKWLYFSLYATDEEYVLGGDSGRGVVDKETTCEYTGLHDKNGKEIYEEDILRCEQWGEEKLFVMKFNDYVLEDGSDNIGTGFLLENGTCDPRECEVIGNVWENPELKPTA